VEFSTFHEYVSAAADLVAILSIPTAVYTYSRRKRAEEQLACMNLEQLQKQADDLAHARLFDDYNDFLKLVMQYPQFGLGDQDPVVWEDLDAMDQIRFQSLFNIFLSVAERAFLLFGNASDSMKERQWEGWRSYIVGVLRRPHVRKEYERERAQYDRIFVREIDTWLGVEEVSTSA